MGNSIAVGKKAKVMKLSGDSFKLKTPISAMEVTKDYPGHVLLESESVRKFGIRAKPLDLQQNLEPKKIYFLIELPKMPEDQGYLMQKPKRVISGGVHMSAKERLESLMISRRSVSDLTAVKQQSFCSSGGHLQVKMKLPRSQVQKLMADSKDEADFAEKIVGLLSSQAIH